MKTSPYPSMASPEIQRSGRMKVTIKMSANKSKVVTIQAVPKVAAV